MKKKILAIILGIMLGVSLVGCGGNSPEKTSDDTYEYLLIGNRKFVEIETSGGLLEHYSCIYVDCETRVQYVMFNGGYYGSMSALLDADGKPILYEGELK